MECDLARTQLAATADRLNALARRSLAALDRYTERERQSVAVMERAWDGLTGDRAARVSIALLLRELGPDD